MFRRRRSSQPHPLSEAAVREYTAPALVGFNPPGHLYEFRAGSGEYISLHDFWCTDIAFRPRTCQLALSFQYDDDEQGDGTGPASEDLIVVMTFEDAEILSWEDEGDGPGGLPDEVSPGVRGQVEDLKVVNGVVRLGLLNVMVVFTASRVTYDLHRKH
jgi:hypothetical protein